ncbi:hypothetical protein LguiA_021881 [Lonicera macranthoides]
MSFSESVNGPTYFNLGLGLVISLSPEVIRHILDMMLTKSFKQDFVSKIPIQKRSNKPHTAEADGIEQEMKPSLIPFSVNNSLWRPLDQELVTGLPLTNLGDLKTGGKKGVKKRDLRAEAFLLDLSRPSFVEMEAINDCEQLDQILTKAAETSTPIIIDWSLSLASHILRGDGGRAVINRSLLLLIDVAAVGAYKRDRVQLLDIPKSYLVVRWWWKATKRCRVLAGSESSVKELA